LQQRLLKTGGRSINHARYYWLLAESPCDVVALSQDVMDRDVIPGCTALCSDYSRLPSDKLERWKVPRSVDPARICELG
jgi:hypothetical protein